MPASVRHDPEGAPVGRDPGVKLAPTAGEAHCQSGIVERLIGTLINTAERNWKEQIGGRTFPEVVALAARSHNQVERVKGFSPTQWAVWRQPSWTEGLHDANPNDVNP